MELEAALSIKKLVASKNIAEHLSEEDLTVIGNAVFDGWRIDSDSRSQWEEKSEDALTFALQIMQEKTFPWPGASNIKFPLVTVAAMQYHARAYPALLPGPTVIECNIPKKDPDGRFAAQAERIEQHMSFQIIEEDHEWEEQMDKVLLVQAILGCVFKKTYFDVVKGHNVSRMILPNNLYLPYFATSVEDAQRVTEVIELSSNAVYERKVRGLFLDKDITTNTDMLEDTPLDISRQEAQGITRPSNDPSRPYTFLEQHCWLDLDGDGYQEPYVVTIHKDTRTVYRIVARYVDSSIKQRNGKVISIEADQYYTKFPFIPSPDGGIYDIGFGVLLGPLNGTIDTIVNQLIDSGTLSNTAGGFLGRGVKMKGGDSAFRPFEWKRVDSTGDDLQKGIMPLPVREPSPTLFQLLGLLIEYGERIGMATDPMTGANVGQNTKTGTMDAMLEEGSRVFNAIFKRTYRALKSEFRKLFKLNQIYFEDNPDPLTGYMGEIKKEDYYISDKCITPSADPYMSGEKEKLQQAMAMKQSSMSTPGYNRYEVEKKFLKAIKVDDIDIIFPDPKGPNAVPPPPNPKVQVEQMKMQLKQMELQISAKQAVMELMQEAELNKAKIIKMEAEAAKAMAEADGVKTGHAIALLEAQIGAAKQHQDGITKVIDVLQRQLDGDRTHEREIAKLGAANQGGMGTMAPPPGNPPAA